MPDLTPLDAPTNPSILFEGHLMVTYSDSLIVSISSIPPLEATTREIHWKIKERNDLNSEHAVHGQSFAVPFDFIASGDVLGDKICVVGTDADNKLIVENWHRHPREGGLVAGHYMYRPGAGGFNAEFTVPESVQGGGAFITPGMRVGTMRTERTQILKQDLGLIPLCITAYPDGLNFYALAKDRDSPHRVLLHVLSEPSKTTVSTIADSDTYPWMIHASVVDIPIFLKGATGFALVLTAEPTYGPNRTVTHHPELLCFEDIDGNGRFESAVLYTGEGEFLQFYTQGRLPKLTRCGPLY
ncbi:MAG: hypothetical protein JKY61_12860 [Planctomycetes bacterium]|nr:hypothetical protein [Planctomycetota bacterium]